MSKMPRFMASKDYVEEPAYICDECRGNPCSRFRQRADVTYRRCKHFTEGGRCSFGQNKRGKQ